MSALDRLRKLDAEATKGPWRLARETYENWLGRHIDVVDVEPLDLRDNETGESLLDDGDAELIVALRNALPALIAYMEAADKCRQWERGSEISVAYDAAEAAFARALEGEK